MKKITKKQTALLIVGTLLLLILLIGGTYAYFNVNTNMSRNGANITGSAKDLGTPTIKTVTSNLYLNLNASLMSQKKVGTTYFANSDSVGTALTTNPNYTLAEISLTNGTTALDCTYNFKVTASVKNAIIDSSDNDVKVEVAGNEMTLKEIIAAGTDGIIVSGEVNNLTAEANRLIGLSSSVTNTANTQDNLVDNTYTITVEPYSDSTVKTFDCKIHEKTWTDFLITAAGLWNSGLEDDGYRFIGTGVTCTYDSGNYVGVAVNQDTTPTCPTLYNYIRTKTSDSSTTNYTYQTSCPTDDGTYTYSCTELSAVPDAESVPNNFICFGTSDRDTCINDMDTYMYRIIGIFPDLSGEYHVKIIKYKQITSLQWYPTKRVVYWSSSLPYTELNSTAFLTNDTYLNSEWKEKIENWKWTSVLTNSWNGGPNYNKFSARNVYLHEMNKTGKISTRGIWTTPTAKIGLMYASDYMMSLGDISLLTSNGSRLKTGWLNQYNNDTTKSECEWTVANAGYYAGIYHYFYYAWGAASGGSLTNTGVTGSCSARPVFYLTSDVESSSGTGTLTDPYILQ